MYPSPLIRAHTTALRAGLIALAGCVSDPLPWICPAVDEGQLVLTEIRGPQQEPDSMDQFVELYNGSADATDLLGLRLVIERLDGAHSGEIMIRNESDLPPDSYFTIAIARTRRTQSGLSEGQALAASAAQTDFSGPLPAGIRLSLMACDRTLDTVTIPELPKLGTWSLAGAPPNALANDDPSAWCQDAHTPTGPQTQLGRPGTPGAANGPCVGDD